jgi:hypothetical protein
MNLEALREVFSHQGPFVTVHAEVGRETEDARQQLDARWTTIRQQLEQEGLGQPLIDSIGSRLRENPRVPGEARRTIVAAGDDIVFDDVQPGHSIWPETTEVAPLPDLSGWLHQADAQLPFVLIVADREGADVDFYRAVSQPDPEHREVHGETLHITKVPEGDWAQKQFQNRSENVWKQNAGEVADLVRSVCRSHRPRVVCLAGEERARAEVTTALEGLETELVQIAAGGRAAGASEEALWDEVRVALARIVAADDQQVADRLLESSGQGRGAARGVGDVVDALVKGQVDRLVLDLEAARDMTVRAKDHPGLALPPTVGDQDLPADRVLVAAGAATDADVSLLPTDQSRGAGVAALLRWDG